MTPNKIGRKWISFCKAEPEVGLRLKRFRPVMRLGEWETMRETLPEKCETGKPDKISDKILVFSKGEIRIVVAFKAGRVWSLGYLRREGRLEMAEMIQLLQNNGGQWTEHHDSRQKITWWSVGANELVARDEGEGGLTLQTKACGEAYLAAVKSALQGL